MYDLDETTRAGILAARGRSAQAHAEWRAGDPFREAAAAFADGTEAPERIATRAEALLADSGWVAALFEPLVGALAADPFFEPPFKVHRDALRVGAVLLDTPAASIAASVTSAAAMARLPAPRAIVFTGRIAVTRAIRAGGARLTRWRAAPIEAGFQADAAPPCASGGSMPLRDGAVHRTDGRDTAQLLCDATSDVVTLVVTIRAGAAPLLREYDRASGALIRVGDADDRPSRTEMLLRLLRVTGRSDAGSCFAEATRAPHFHLRWAAMREWLALDAHAALPRLVVMAHADSHAEVRAAALRTLPLVERRLAEARCRG